MKKQNDPAKNYETTRRNIGYTNRKDATQKEYDRIGFMSGLEVHQQLLTKSKLFCRCPAGKYQSHEDYHAELVRHMRPTLSELGEYDGTALMEFKTRKEIIYRIKNETACTYEVDDTPPFKIDPEALEIALEIAILSKLNIVGEVHITRKQYLDGSIPTGFQRTAILGVEGVIHLSNKDIRLIQLSIEEDSCREISDIGHQRIYKTDRLGMPLIETVTYPDMVNPDEVKEACDYIRFLNRSTGKVRMGIGAGRQDVNVSCRGGNRVEIKGVAHTKWIPELTHIECYRQWALLAIRDLLVKNQQFENWAMAHKELQPGKFMGNAKKFLFELKKKGFTIQGINLPGFYSLLSHFTQPGKVLANEFSDRLKVIACIEKPNMTQSEDLESVLDSSFFNALSTLLNAGENDAQIVLWGPADDMKTALETVEERAKMCFAGVPLETRKSFVDGTTIFERVLPGADRMYPDTDSAPIPLENEYIDELGKKVPIEVVKQKSTLRKWNVPEDTHVYLLRNNLVVLLEKIYTECNVEPRFAATLLGHKMKHIEGQQDSCASVKNTDIIGLFRFIRDEQLDPDIAIDLLQIISKSSTSNFSKALKIIGFRKSSIEEIKKAIVNYSEVFEMEGRNQNKTNRTNWIMGQVHKQAVGNIKLSQLHELVEGVK